MSTKAVEEALSHAVGGAAFVDSLLKGAQPGERAALIRTMTDPQTSRKEKHHGMLAL